MADLTFLLALALLRRLLDAVALVRSGGWGYLLGSELQGKTYGVVGTGRIGREVARRVAACGAQVLGHDIVPDRDDGEVRGLLRYVPLDDLLARSDVVSLHVPLTSATRGLLRARELALMKPGAFLVNVARGGVVDEEALYDSLASGRLGGAALDVFATEPPGASRLLSLPTVLPTPHIGGSTVEVAHRLAHACAEVVGTFLRGGRPPVVNPEVWDRG